MIQSSEGSNPVTGEEEEGRECEELMLMWMRLLMMPQDAVRDPVTKKRVEIIIQIQIKWQMLSMIASDDGIDYDHHSDHHNSCIIPKETTRIMI